ncbi:MAG: hypothetical protein ACLR5Q_10245 [Coprococcus sp.]
MRSGAGTSKGVIEVIYLEDTLTVVGQDKDSSGNIWYKARQSPAIPVISVLIC